MKAILFSITKSGVLLVSCYSWQLFSFLFRDNGVKAIENLMQKRGKFDYILLETTGLADPGPIAGIFWMDEELCSDLYLDAIITVVDAKYCKNVCRYLLFHY